MDNSTPEKSSSLHSSAMNSLLNACSTGNTSELEHLLQTSPSREIALAHEQHPYNAVEVSIPNLVLLLQSASTAGHAAAVDALLQFSHANDIAYNTLITRDVMMAALDGRSLDVLQSCIGVMPEAANLDLGHLNDPLSQCLHKELPHHVSFLLEHGANPNTPCAGYKGSGYHLRLAAQKLPLEYTTLLLQKNATVSQSGAMQMAAEKGRLDVLQALVEHGGDVNERLEPNVGYLSHRRKQQQASETLLHLAVMAGQPEVVQWLLNHGASVVIEDMQGKTALMIAKEAENKDILDILEKYSAK